MKRGKLIEVCGLDGSGKSTHSEKIKEILLKNGYKASCEHGYKPHKNLNILKKITNSTTTLELKERGVPQEFVSKLYIMDLIEASYRIEKKLQNGEIIISDKYITDAQVYIPLFNGEGDVVDFSFKSLLKPDIKIFLKISAEESIVRIKKRAKKTGKLITEKECLTIAKLAYNCYEERLTKNANLIINTLELQKNNELKILEYISNKFPLIK